MSKPVPLVVIERARQLISDEQHWCRGAYALGKRGASISFSHPNAVRFCAMGALFKAAFEVCSDEKAATNLAYELPKSFRPLAHL